MDEDSLLSLYTKWVQEACDRKIRAGGVANFLGKRSVYEHLTAERLRPAIGALPIEMIEPWTIEDLALAVRRVLSMTLPAIEENVPPASTNASKRADIAKLRAQIEGLVDALEQDSSALDLLRRVGGGLSIDGSILHLRTLADTLEIVSGGLRVEGAKWKMSALTELRTRQAFYLTPVFERAFGRPATVREDPLSDGIIGPWPDFFATVVRQITGRGFPNARSILKEARQRHLRQPVAFPEDFWPK